MSLYIAGPMTGLEDHGREAFDQATARLRSQGQLVTSPIEVAIEAFGTWEAARKAPYSAHIRNDLPALLACDGVVLLPGWEESPGARIEARVALETGHYFRTYDATLSDSAAPIETSDVDQVVNGTYLTGPTLVGPDSPNRSFGAYEGDRFVPFEENPQRHVFGTGGIKDNRGKPRIDLIPTAPLIAMAEVLEFGTRKYQPHNWRRGLPWPDTYSSLMRHLLAWNDGEDLDKETGLLHLAHADCQLTFLLDYSLSGVGKETDTRFIPCQSEDCDKGLHPTTDHRQKEIA